MAARRYSKFSDPAWTDIDPLKPGMTLYMTFSEFEGRQYLAGVHTRPPRQRTKSLYIRDQLLIHRDHFAILNLYSTRNEIIFDGSREKSTYYYTIDMRNTGLKDVKLHACSDGRFLRVLVPKSYFGDVIEWDTPFVPGPNTYWFFRRPSSGLKRYEYHNTQDISGLTGVVLGARTVGLFCHGRQPTMSFELFARQLKKRYEEKKLIFLYFPLETDEKVHTLAITTSLNRNYCFGPQPQREDYFEYEALRPLSTGYVEGLFYSSPNDSVHAFSDLGLSASNVYTRISGLNISPGESLPCPSVDSPQEGWCFSKASLERNSTIQVCRLSDSVQHCLGVLLTYPNGKRDALGQVRFDKYLSKSWDIEDCVFRNVTIKHLLYVEIKKRSDVADGIDDWYDLPAQGKVVWWCGLNGDQIGILR
ncbi:hypothetical protein PV08_12079 [Exophiala spinifera]|uniref:Uncharacterized protein n=1 Tax=Exophiala spinifera TaxID=91928 RepID=A0A0D2BE46_9EURO|nr:uncharacterized protein PV08_12079 [Exophiala spinifera]KIW09664.1 hypothetical protein PV08_12079 [Exophiala spinifera]